MCPVCKAQACVSEACSRSVTCNQCPVCYSGALFMPLFVPFPSCLHVLCSPIGWSGRHHLFPPTVWPCACSSKWEAGTRNSFSTAQSPVWCFDVSLCLAVCHVLRISGNISSWVSHPCKQTKVNSID